ncbi:tetratricopeptide repeat protein [Winogradskyella wichelsiae]|uniref:tetratricopeptide repeat protein n=1 Tax=Winogradskyella wichelsiae TaxID=2697007 RepID=UPI003EF71999
MNITYFGKLINLLSLIFIFTVNSYAQQSTFDKSLSFIEINKPKTHAAIDSLLKPFRRDTDKMEQLLTLSKQHTYNEGACYAVNALGVIQRDKSNYDNALGLHQEAQAYAEKANSDEFKIISFNMIGVVYRRMDIVKLALDYHTKALKLANSIEQPTSSISHNIAVSQNSIGNIYLVLKQYDLAISQFNKSLTIGKRIDDKLGLAINYHNIGYAEEAKEHLDNALVNYQTSLNYNNNIDSEIGRVICYNSIGLIYLKKGNYKAARPIISEALKKALDLEDQFYIVASYISFGKLELQTNQLNSANEHLKKALQISKAYNLKSSVAESSKLLSEISKKNGDFKAALNYYQDAEEIENTILTKQNLQYVNDIVVAYENENKNNQIKALAEENESVRLHLERNKKIILYTSLLLIPLSISTFLIYRTRALKRDKHILTLEQDMLRSQMNPHFIFNSLNSIKLYIINNDKANAVYYLNKFSKLIRKILIASKEKETSLHDEIETMKIYMNIENIRFSNEIDFVINIDPTINTEVIKIPSLVLQPFLENALWHGLSSKDSGKKIALNISRTSSHYIIVDIIDNGIGRVASKKINDNKHLERKSLGIDITKARLENFSESYIGSYSLEIKDLYNSKKPIGTKVSLQIPTLKVT